MIRMFVRTITVALIACCCTATWVAPNALAATSGWQKEDGLWHYYLQSGAEATNQWVKYKGYWYRLGDDGVMLANCSAEVKGSRYFFDGSGRMLANSWHKEDGLWHYYLQSGTEATNQWVKYNGYWYRLGDDGVMLANCHAEVKGSIYFFDGSGKMLANGWRLTDEGWCYLESNGAAKTGWRSYKGAWYYLSPTSGIMQTGVVEVRGVEYVLNDSGAMLANQWLDMGDGTWWHLAANGAVDTKVAYDESGALVTPDGSAITGWIQLSDGWHYYDPETGMPVFGWVKYNNGWFYLDPETGIMQTGWLLIDEDWFYLTSTGRMAAGTWISGKYYVNGSGRWVYTWPLWGNYAISSDFGPRPRPTAGASTNHKGIDIPADMGTPIRAIKDGILVNASYDPTMGNHIIIDHGDGTRSYYMHQSRFAGLPVGSAVTAGQVIGYVGSTGASTGPHLHLGIMKNGEFVSPWNYFTRP